MGGLDISIPAGCQFITVRYHDEETGNEARAIYIPERTTQIENCFSDVWIEHHAQLNHCVECNNWFVYCYEDEEGWTGDLIPNYCPHCGAKATN